MIQASVRRKLGSFSLSAEIDDGGFICLAGRNGSGKTCFLKAISGLLEVDEGFVRVGGADVTRLPIERRGVVMVTPNTSIPHMNVDDHLRWGAKLRGATIGEARFLKVKADLGIDFGGRVRNLSLGMKERVSLATALLSKPRAILVDEAFANLHESRAFVTAYRNLAAESGTDVVFTTQDESYGGLSDHLYLISQGETRKVS